MAADLPFVIDPTRCNCLALRKATRRMSQFYDSALAPSGLLLSIDSLRRRHRDPGIRRWAER